MSRVSIQFARLCTNRQFFLFILQWRDNLENASVLLGEYIFEDQKNFLFSREERYMRVCLDRFMRPCIFLDEIRIYKFRGAIFMASTAVFLN